MIEVLRIRNDDAYVRRAPVHDWCKKADIMDTPRSYGSAEYPELAIQ